MFGNGIVCKSWLLHVAVFACSDVISSCVSVLGPMGVAVWVSLSGIGGVWELRVRGYRGVPCNCPLQLIL